MTPKETKWRIWIKASPPPDSAKPRVYWWWLFNRVDKAGITLDLEQFKAKGITGVNLICTGSYAGPAPRPEVKYMSPEWWELSATR